MGLVDAEIKEDILGTENKSLEDTVKAIEAQESAKPAKVKLGVATWRSPGSASAYAVGGPVTTSQRGDVRSVQPVILVIFIYVIFI